MRNDQKCSLMCIDQIPQCIHIFKIQKRIRLVHNQKRRVYKHLPDNLNQFALSAAEFCHFKVFQFFKARQFQLLFDIDLAVIPIHRCKQIPGFLILFHQCLYIFSSFHLFADIINFFLLDVKRFFHIGKNRAVFIIRKIQELVHKTNALIGFHLYFSVVQIFIRMCKNPDQCTFSSSVRSNQNTMLSVLNGK